MEDFREKGYLVKYIFLEISMKNMIVEKVQNKEIKMADKQKNLKAE